MLRRNRRAWRAWIADHGASVVREKRAERGGFELRLQSRWHYALEGLEILYFLSLDLGSEAQRRLGKAETDGADDVLDGVLFRLHAQVCLGASEVLALLRTGHASGAMARWRSMYEAAVVLLFIKEHGSNTAERYLLHDSARAYRDAGEFQKHHEKLGQLALDDDEAAGIEADYSELVARIGKAAAKSDYGWASDALFGADSKANVTFKHIEEAVDVSHIRPYYRLASHSVHANFAAQSTQIGLRDPGTKMLCGPSNYGLAEPGNAAAHTLALATVQLLTWRRTSIDFLAASQELMDLSKEVGTRFSAAQSKIDDQEDELELPPLPTAPVRPGRPRRRRLRMKSRRA